MPDKADNEHLLILLGSDLFPENADILKQGRFDYYLNDAPANISEPWIQYQTATHTGTLSARIIEDAELVIYSSSKQRRDNGHQEIIIDWQYCQHSQYYARYCIRDNKLHWQINNHHGHQPIEQGQCFFPLMRVFMGCSVLSLAQGECSELIVPDIRTLDEENSVLIPYRSQRKATLVQENTDLQVSQGSVNVDVYQYQSDIYQADDPALCFIDNERLLRRYTWQQAADRNWRIDNYINS